MSDYKNGKIHLNFIVDELIKESLTSSKEENVASTNKPTSVTSPTAINDYEGFQAHKKIMAVIGIIDLESSANYIAEFNNFRLKINQEMPGIFSFSCFAFNASTVVKNEIKVEDLYFFTKQMKTTLAQEVKTTIHSISYKILDEVEKSIGRDVPVILFLLILKIANKF